MQQKGEGRCRYLPQVLVTGVTGKDTNSSGLSSRNLHLQVTYWVSLNQQLEIVGNLLTSMKKKNLISPSDSKAPLMSSLQN